MSNVTPIDMPNQNQPEAGWLWVHDYSPELVKLYFLSTATCDWLFWYCVMNKHDSESTINYKCDARRAAEVIDVATDILDYSYKPSNLLSELLFQQEGSFPWSFIVQGAVRDNKNASETASSLFYWPPLGSKEKRALEDHVKWGFNRRSHIFNQGNYHDSINWLDIYDMELHEIYRNWIVSKDVVLLKKIRSKLRLVKIHAALYKDQALKQWMAEASYLGLTKKQANDHWLCLWEYLSAKIAYHQTRIDLIEKAVDSPFRPRLIQANTKELTQSFGRTVVDFSEAQIALYSDVISIIKSMSPPSPWSRIPQ
ncbi:hypothetical protein N9478_10410 [Gammaproteobacteria bacterium]|nr:hypothetical protein [Gammaproteobacteria bacterium]